MFKAIRISILLVVLLFVSLSTYLSQARSTDWNNSLYVKVYPINADGSPQSSRYIERLKVESFSDIEEFVTRETRRYGHILDRPVRVKLGREVFEQPPALPETINRLAIMWWSLKMRRWAGAVTEGQDYPDPDVRIFVRYHAPSDQFVLENSVGLQKGMVGVVNGYASRSESSRNNVIIAHEFLHTLGATDKYNPADGTPYFPEGYAEPDKSPLYPQTTAEIMGGRVALTASDARMPASLKHTIIGPTTASEIRLQ